MNAVRDAAWTTDQMGRVRLAPEGLYGRAKMLALLRRTGHPQASPGSVDRAMRALGLSGVRRGRPVRTTVAGKDGVRAGALLNRDFTAVAPNTVWVTDFTYVRTWSGFVYVAFIVDVFAQRIVAWHAQNTKHTSLVMTPLRMALRCQVAAPAGRSTASHSNPSPTASSKRSHATGPSPQRQPKHRTSEPQKFGATSGHRRHGYWKALANFRSS
ncbi:hypothetical protein E8P82_11840 [Arthrobacter echini]|nr:hypothetical protein E8P82_11840 [Arthrobacter echini]